MHQPYQHDSIIDFINKEVIQDYEPNIIHRVHFKISRDFKSCTQYKVSYKIYHLDKINHKKFESPKQMSTLDRFWFEQNIMELTSDLGANLHIQVLPEPIIVIEPFDSFPFRLEFSSPALTMVDIGKLITNKAKLLDILVHSERGYGTLYISPKADNLTVKNPESPQTVDNQRLALTPSNVVNFVAPAAVEQTKEEIFKDILDLSKKLNVDVSTFMQCDSDWEQNKDNLKTIDSSHPAPLSPEPDLTAKQLKTSESTSDNLAYKHFYQMNANKDQGERLDTASNALNSLDDISSIEKMAAEYMGSVQAAGEECLSIKDSVAPPDAPTLQEVLDGRGENTLSGLQILKQRMKQGYATDPTTGKIITEAEAAKNNHARVLSDEEKEQEQKEAELDSERTVEMYKKYAAAERKKSTIRADAASMNGAAEAASAIKTISEASARASGIPLDLTKHEDKHVILDDTPIPEPPFPKEEVKEEQKEEIEVESKDPEGEDLF